MKLTEKQLKQMICESVEEVCNEEGLDEGWFGNAMSSLGKGIQGTIRGGLDQGRQMYNQNMASRSQADADAARAESERLRATQNYGFKDIPACQKIEAKYDGQIQKLNTQISQLQTQIKQLEKQKETERLQAKREYQSSVGKQASKFGKQANSFSATANNANDKATQILNRRRQSLGLGNIEQDQAANGTMNESKKIDSIIRESIRKYAK